jgi:hypothetical protein
MTDPMDDPTFRRIFAMLTDALGPEYAIDVPEMIAETDRQGLVGFGVRRKDGTEMSETEITDLLASKGITIEGLHATPDALDDATVAALEPDTLNGDYGPHAGDFVVQLSGLLALEWTETMQTLEKLVEHFKQAGVERDDAEHLLSFAATAMIAGMRSRQHLGVTLEGYRRDHHLTADQIETLVRAANQRVQDGQMDDVDRLLVERVRDLYLDDQALSFSWPPLAMAMTSYQQE